MMSVLEFSSFPTIHQSCPKNSQRFLETYSNPFAFLTPNFHKITEDAFNADTFIHSADQLSFELLKNTITPYFRDKINGSI